MKQKRSTKILRFTVSGALLVGSALPACGGEQDHVNEPAPEHVTSNEPAPEETVNEPEPEETVNEPEPEPEPEPVGEEPPTVNEPAPSE